MWQIILLSIYGYIFSFSHLFKLRVRKICRCLARDGAVKCFVVRAQIFFPPSGCCRDEWAVLALSNAFTFYVLLLCFESLRMVMAVVALLFSLLIVVIVLRVTRTVMAMIVVVMVVGMRYRRFNHGVCRRFFLPSVLP